ncbi:MAG TPA: flavodoxin domain-containing protein [Spirochaetales bacterium]|nr:hypothetical protein [Spirochaetales bacterium]HPE36754.1 flavodoxin domain-containing protein [Spirochaetales bacterium]
MSVLVAYSTRFGYTKKTAELIAERLRLAGKTVDTADARKVNQAQIDGHSSFVVGSSIAAGQWKGPAKRLLGRLAGAGKPVAVFVSAGGVMTGKKPGSAPDAPPEGTIEERQAEAVRLFAQPVCAALGLKPVAQSAFGGRMAFFGKEMFNSWDARPVETWADSLAGTLS